MCTKTWWWVISNTTYPPGNELGLLLLCKRVTVQHTFIFPHSQSLFYVVPPVVPPVTNQCQVHPWCVGKDSTYAGLDWGDNGRSSLNILIWNATRTRVGKPPWLNVRQSMKYNSTNRSDSVTVQYATPSLERSSLIITIYLQHESSPSVKIGPLKSCWWPL